jgi:hypothetical protein
MIPDRKPTKRRDIYGRSWHKGNKEEFLNEFNKHWPTETITGYYQNGDLALYIIKQRLVKVKQKRNSFMDEIFWKYRR